MIISTITNKSYQRYVPWFVFFITKSYPDYKVKIYLTENIIHKKAFEFVRTDNVQYIENSFRKYPKNNQELKTLLFFTREYENTYQAGDVDVLICREKPSLEKYYLNLCQERKLIYHSYYRPGTKRIITGSHFVTPEYFKIMKPVILKYQRLHLQRKLNLKVARNEHIVYNMLAEAGLKLLPQEFSTLHGFHLGIWKGRKIPPPRLIHLAPLYHLSWYDYFLEIEKTPEYKKLTELLPLHEIPRMKKSMENYIKSI